MNLSSLGYVPLTLDVVSKPDCCLLLGLTIAIHLKIFAATSKTCRLAHQSSLESCQEACQGLIWLQSTALKPKRSFSSFSLSWRDHYTPIGEISFLRNILEEPGTLRS